MKKEDWLTSGQVAKQIGVSKPTIQLWAREGKIKCYTFPGSKHRRFLKTDIEKLEKQIEESYERN